MSGSTIYELFQRSIAKGPFGEGSEACVYTIDDPAFDGYLLKVLKRGLTEEGSLSPLVTPEDKICAIKTGYVNMKVGQMMASHMGEHRFFTIIVRAPGIPMEDKMKADVAACGDECAGTERFIDDLIALSEAGYKEFFDEVNQSTRLNYGLDVMGERNTLVDANGLHNIDLGGRYSSDHGNHFLAEHFNHLDAIAAHIQFMIEDNITTPFTAAQQQRIDTKLAALKKRMEHAAETVGLPQDADAVLRWHTRQRFHSMGILGVTKIAVSMSDPPERLLQVIHRGKKLESIAPIKTGARQLP